jgi:hypothetical protein
MSISTNHLFKVDTLKIDTLNPDTVNADRPRISNEIRARHTEVFPAVRFDSRTLTRCHVCGFAEIRTDEVLDSEVLFLAECPRCENRWTSRQPIGTPVTGPVSHAAPVRLVARRFERVPARVARRIAPAA